MKFKAEIIDVAKNIHLLSVEGRIKIGNLEPIEKEFGRLAGSQGVKLIVDVQNVDAIDSSGIGELIKARTKLIESGGNMVLLGSGTKVEMVMKLSGLINYFPVATNQDEAIELLNQPPQTKTTETSGEASDSEQE